MYHKIGALAKHFGITPQALRFYEQQGLLQADREELGGARRYHSRNFKWLYSIRSYHELGFGVKEIWDIFALEEPEELAVRLRAKAEATREEIAILERRLTALHQQEEDLLRISELLDSPRLDMMPALWVLVNQFDQHMDLSPDVSDSVQAWMSHIPFVYSASIISTEAFAAPDEPLARESGFCVEPEMAERIGLEPGASAVLMEPVQAVHLVSKLRLEGDTLRSLLGRGLEFAAEQGLTVSGPAVGRCVGKTGEEQCQENLCPKNVYYEYWLPTVEQS